MKSYSPREVIKILEKNNWKLFRIKGDHYIFKKERERYLTTIPISRNTIPIGTIKSIEKQTGIKFKDK